MGINWSNTWQALEMGRVSKHKKIKACDPFYKGPRRDASRSVNLPPGGLEDDQPVPKSLLRLIQAGQRTSGFRGKPISKIKLLQQGQVKDKPMRDDSQSTPEGSVYLRNEKEEPAFKRRKGESLKDFLERIDVEGRARMVESYKANRKMTERRKKYYEKRKQRLESRKGRGKREEDAVEFDDLKDDVLFGEVASAPPRLIAKPRGSQKTKTKTNSKSLSQDKESNPDAEISMTMDPSPKTVSVVGLKRKQDIEDERERMIQEYRVSKKAKLSRTKPKNRRLIL